MVLFSSPYYTQKHSEVLKPWYQHGEIFHARSFDFSVINGSIDMITFVHTHFYIITDDVLSLPTPTGWFCFVYYTAHKNLTEVTEVCDAMIYPHDEVLTEIFEFSIRYEWIDVITFVPTHLYTIRDDVLSLQTGWVFLV